MGLVNRHYLKIVWNLRCGFDSANVLKSSTCNLIIPVHQTDQT